MHVPLLSELRARSNVEEIISAVAAGSTLTEDLESYIIPTDGALARPEFHRHRSEAVRFVQDGGILKIWVWLREFHHTVRNQRRLSRFLIVVGSRRILSRRFQSQRHSAEDPS